YCREPANDRGEPDDFASFIEDRFPHRRTPTARWAEPPAQPMVPPRASLQRNFAWYGTALKLSSLPLNPRAQTTDVQLDRTGSSVRPAAPLRDWAAAITLRPRGKLVCGTEQQNAKVNTRKLRGEATMKEPSIAWRLRSALQQRLDVVLHEPLPKRWVNLIHE